MLYSNKIKPYSFINPNLISAPRSGMASAVKSGGSRIGSTFAASSKKTLLGLNRLGSSLASLGETQRQIRDVISIQLVASKDVKALKLRRKQYLRDQQSERQTELAGQKKGEVVDKEEVKKEGEKKLSWLEKLLGPFKGIVEFALRTIITQGILRWMSDPKNGERLEKVVSGLSKFFGFIFGIVSWSIGSFMSGISNVFGDGSKGGLSRFAEILGGLGQIIVGIAGLKAASYLLNPFSLIGDILGLLDVMSSKDTSGGGDLPTDKPGKPGRAERGALTKFGRNAFVKTLGKGGAKSALTFFKKTVSPILKRIPIIGGLIDFAINVFVFKESPGKAAFKAIGAGLLGWIGGALGSVIPGPGTFVGALLGGMAGDSLGGLLYDAIFGKSKKDDEPALAEGGLVTKPTRAIIGEKGPEIIIPLAMMGSVGGTGPVISILSSALTGALSAMGSSGELAKQVISDDLAEMQKQAGGARPAQPGETLGKSVVKAGVSLEQMQLGAGSGEVNEYIGVKSSYGKKSSRNTLRGALANILGVFESITKKSFSTGGGGGTGGSGGGSDSGDLGPIEEIKPGPMHTKGAQIAKNLMRLLGIKDYQAAGIVGNLIQESALVPDRIQGKPPNQGGPLKLDGRTGYSYPQWTSIDRQKNFAAYMESKGFDWRNRGATDEMATGFLAKEFKGYMSSVFKNTKDAAAASNWVLFNYEKPADQGVGEQRERSADSQAVLNKMARGGKIPMDSPEYKEKWSGDGRDEMLKKFSAGGKAIVEGAKKIIGQGRGVVNQCAITTRDALKAAKHPSAKKPTGIGDLDTPRGSSFSKVLDYAASFGGSDMGTVIKDKSQVMAGDILLWKADRDLGGTSNKGAITHVGIAADDGLKHQYDHNVSRGFHYRPHWGSSGGTSWFAAIRLGGSGTIGPGESTTTSGSSSVEEKEMTPEEQLKSIFSKMASDIMKLNTASSEPQSTSSSPSPAVKPVPNQNQNLDKLSASAAALEEDNKPKASIVPVPTAINSGSASAPAAQPPVVRARKPITYGF